MSILNISKRKDKESGGGSPRSSRNTPSRKQNRSSKSIKYQNMIYTIEGYVTDDSWPLNKEEKDVVDKYKESCLLITEKTNPRESMHSFVKNR